jgi:hypothetical protein
MAKFTAYDYRHRVLLPVSLADQLLPGTLEFAIRELKVLLRTHLRHFYLSRHTIAPKGLFFGLKPSRKWLAN